MRLRWPAAAPPADWAAAKRCHCCTSQAHVSHPNMFPRAVYGGLHTHTHTRSPLVLPGASFLHCFSDEEEKTFFLGKRDFCCVSHDFLSEKRIKGSIISPLSVLQANAAQVNCTCQLVGGPRVFSEHPSLPPCSIV